MQIAIIGAGNVGGSLARGWSRAGHHIVLGVRDAADPKVAALSRATGADVKVPAEAAVAAEVVVLALPWAAAEGAVKALGGLRDKIVIDCMNPLAMQDGKLGLDRKVRRGSACDLDPRRASRKNAQSGGRRDDGAQ